MNIIALAWLLTMALGLSSASAQSTTPQAQALDQPTEGPGSGTPANICQELVAFVREAAQTREADSVPTQLATAVNAPKPDDGASKPSDATGITQRNSGLSGQIPSAGGPGSPGPQGATQNAAAPVGSTATATEPSTVIRPASEPSGARPAPSVTPAAPPSPKPTSEAVQQIEVAAGSGDLGGCRAAAQRMRRAGVAMPAPLLALAAMELSLLERARR